MFRTAIVATLPVRQAVPSPYLVKPDRDELINNEEGFGRTDRQAAEEQGPSGTYRY